MINNKNKNDQTNTAKQWRSLKKNKPWSDKKVQRFASEFKAIRYTKANLLMDAYLD